jgi:hypothetical protein
VGLHHLLATRRQGHGAALGHAGRLEGQRHRHGPPGLRSLTSVSTTTASTLLGSATAVFTPADVGTLAVGAGIPANANVTALGRIVADGQTTSGGTTLTSATGAFAASDVGAALYGAGIQSGTVIASRTDATHVVMSKSATATAAADAVNIATPYQVTLSKAATATASVSVSLVPDPTYALYGIQLVVWFGA